METRDAPPTLEDFKKWCCLEITMCQERLKFHDQSTHVYADTEFVMRGMSYTLASIEIFKKELEDVRNYAKHA